MSLDNLFIKRYRGVTALVTSRHAMRGYTYRTTFTRKGITCNTQRVEIVKEMTKHLFALELSKQINVLVVVVIFVCIAHTNITFTGHIC